MKKSFADEYERRQRKENIFTCTILGILDIIVVGVGLIATMLGYTVLKLFIWPCVTSVF